MTVKSLHSRITALALALFALLALTPSHAWAVEKLEASNLATNDQPHITMTVAGVGDNGLPLLGLEPADIVVTENGVPQPNVVLYPFYERPTPVDIVLALDTSDSMRGQPFEDAKAAALNFIANVGIEDRVALVGFGRTAELIHPLTSDADSLTEAITSLRLTANTALADAMIVASQEAARSTNPKVVILMTDGADFRGKHTVDQAFQQVLPLKVPVFTVGFTEHVRAEQLQQIASRTGGNYYSALDRQALSEVFVTIAQQLHQEYRLSYDSTTLADAGAKVEVQVSLRGADAQQGQTLTYEYTARQVARAADAPVATGNLPVVNPGKPAQPLPTPPLGGYGLPLSAALATLCFVAGLVMVGMPDRTQRRMAEFVGVFVTGFMKPVASSALIVLLRPLVVVVSSLVLRVMPAKQQRRLADNLAAAGHPRGWRLAQFVTLKSGIAALLGVLLLLATGQLLGALAGAALGFYMPSFWLAKKIKQRRGRILRQMPDALDLLTISVHAGLGFDAALLEVVQKWDNEISQEFATVLGEMKLGKSRRDALKSLAKRVEIHEMKLFVSAIVQADETGMSIGRTLAVQAEQMRLRRRQRAEELAHKAVIKIIIPMVLFIFPSIFVVLLGPSVPSVLQGLSNLTK